MTKKLPLFNNELDELTMVSTKGDILRQGRAGGLIVVTDVDSQIVFMMAEIKTEVYVETPTEMIKIPNPIYVPKTINNNDLSRQVYKLNITPKTMENSN